jgi:hypothetical protein
MKYFAVALVDSIMSSDAKLIVERKVEKLLPACNNITVRSLPSDRKDQIQPVHFDFGFHTKGFTHIHSRSNLETAIQQVTTTYSKSLARVSGSKQNEG